MYKSRNGRTIYTQTEQAARAIYWAEVKSGLASFGWVIVGFCTLMGLVGLIGRS